MSFIINTSQLTLNAILKVQHQKQKSNFAVLAVEQLFYIRTEDITRILKYQTFLKTRLKSGLELLIYVLSIELFLKDVGTLPSIITTTACANQQHVTKLVRCSHDLHRPLQLHLYDSMSPSQKVHLSYHPHISNSF